MRSKILCVGLVSLWTILSHAQIVGIGNSNPQEKLDVNGGVKVAEAVGTENGTIQYQNNKFQGRKNS